VSDKPLFLQIKQRVEDMILSRSLGPDDQVPSSTQMVKFYQVNHLTVLKGLNLLVDEEIIYKKRGVGMFVRADARDRILRTRRERLIHEFVQPLVREARRLDLTAGEVSAIIARVSREEDLNDDDDA
jgi:GntR family transcriptional regulator